MRRAPSLPNETSGTVWVELCTVHPWPMGALNYALSRPGRCIQTPKYSYPRCTRGDCSYRPVFIFLSSLSFSLCFTFLSPLFCSSLFSSAGLLADSKLFELASRDPNRPLPLPARVNAFLVRAKRKNDREVKQRLPITESVKKTCVKSLNALRANYFSTCAVIAV